jgi:hypothetical protein
LGSGLYPARRFGPRKISKENLPVMTLSCKFLERIAEKQQGWIQRELAMGPIFFFFFFIKRLYLGVGRIGDIEESATPYLILYGELTTPLSVSARGVKVVESWPFGKQIV